MWWRESIKIGCVHKVRDSGLESFWVMRWRKVRVRIVYVGRQGDFSLLLWNSLVWELFVPCFSPWWSRLEYFSIWESTVEYWRKRTMSLSFRLDKLLSLGTDWYSSSSPSTKPACYFLPIFHLLSLSLAATVFETNAHTHPLQTHIEQTWKSWNVECKSGLEWNKSINTYFEWKGRRVKTWEWDLY